MINLEDYKTELNGESYVPLSIAKQALKEAFVTSKEYDQTIVKLEELNVQFKDAMKELGEGFEELGNVKV